MHFISIALGLMAMHVAALPLPAHPSHPECTDGVVLIGSVLKCKENHKSLQEQAMSLALQGELPVAFQDKIQKPNLQPNLKPIPRDAAAAGSSTGAGDCNGALVVDLGSCLHLGDAESAYITQSAIKKGMTAIGKGQDFTPVAPKEDDDDDEDQKLIHIV